MQHVQQDEALNDCLACLLSAISFDAKWKKLYEEDDIIKGNFENDDKSISRIKFMWSMENEYLENEYFTGFAKPYVKDYSFVGLIPKENHSKMYLTKALDNTDIQQMYKERMFEDVHLIFHKQNKYF